MSTLVPRVVKAATDRRIELADAKSFVVVDHDEDNNLLTGMIDTAFDWLQPPRGCLAFSIAAQTLRVDLPCWPLQRITLPAPPVQSISSVKYFDENNVDRTLDPSNYFVDNDTLMWSLTFTGASLYTRPSAVRIEYIAGMSDDDFNGALRMAMLRIVKQLYDYRDEYVSGVSFDPEVFGVDALIMPYRFR